MHKYYDIALASYNGSKYIDEQIDSLLKAIEGCKEARIRSLVISDDNSSDGTEKIVEKYCKKYPFIKFVVNKKGKGVKCNFENALSNCNSEYVFFCDQDDVWHENKIKDSMNQMDALESKYSGVPLLVFSNVNFVTDKLSFISTGVGFKAEEFSDPRYTAFRSYGQGCTMLLNKKLIELSRFKIPIECVMHDWWFLVLASNFGKVSFIKEALIDYRQHSNNVCGGTQKRSLKRYFNLDNQRKYFKEVEVQAKFFLEYCINNKLVVDKEVEEIYKFLSTVKAKSFFSRVVMLIRVPMFKSGIREKVKLCIQVLS